MAGSVNTPLLGTAAAVSITDALEHVIVTGPAIFTNNVQTQVQLAGDVDLLNSSSGATVTLRIRRGTTTSGTLVDAFGPTTATASARASFTVSGNDAPGEVHNQSYVLTAQVASNAGTVTVETATLQAVVTGST